MLDMPWSFPMYDVMVLSALALGAVVLYRRRSTKSRGTDIPGPKREDWLWGYSRVLLTAKRWDYISTWQKEYGSVLRIPTVLTGSSTMFLDVKAIHYIVSTHSDNFQRPEAGRKMLKRMLGGGILTSEGEDHKRFRRTMSPGFSAASIRYFTSLFLDIAQKAKNHWLDQMDLEGKEEVTINVEPWLSDMSFDSMGEAGFSHSFNAVDGSKPLVAQLFDSFGGARLLLFRRMLFVFLRDAAIFRWLPIAGLLTDRTREAMTEIARNVMHDEGALQDAKEGRRSLVASILKEEDRKLSESEVVAQMNTLILAAYLTTSHALTWCFHELSSHPTVQTKLRAELQRFPNPTALQIENEMPYLDVIVKECLRLHPTIPVVRRVAMADAFIPLSAPILTRDGQIVPSIHLPAGAELTIPIEPMNRSTLIWGADAEDFRPERWLAPLPEGAQEVGGWNHTLTFLDGPRNCIGRNFAVAEIKAILVTFFRDLSIQPWKDGTDVKPELAFFVRARNEGVKGLILRVRKLDVE
ncbi:cytochrome P450 [Calocera viscosa TUFC12733]|uniref:Cytochrome P450 n=1 Tax=Calocera viscosa (strain TUFC12733) TaxID=1330018 RepID=A0A167JQ29_CALVF|nr:cytochrome P450 [Calocera viscosa TUFC12733]